MSNLKRVIKDGFWWGVCASHGSWYDGSVECPECFKTKQLKWWKRIFV